MSEPGSAACYQPDGSWSCIRDHVTEPCGDCDGCRLVRAENATQGSAATPKALVELMRLEAKSEYGRGWNQGLSDAVVMLRSAGWLRETPEKEATDA